MDVDTQPIAQDQSGTLLEVEQRFSQSLLWQLQRRFFEHEGIQAWQQGQVPHYITSNPHIANAYAQVVLGFLQDCHRHSCTPSSSLSQVDQSLDLTLDPTQPIYIVELGAGSGRFAYHFLKKFQAAYAQSPLQRPVVRYILTDFTEQNLTFWQTHPAWQPWIDQGLVDFACFDAEHDPSMTLTQSGAVLTAGSLTNPLIVIANYVLDTIPQDLFWIQAGQLFESRVTLTSPQAEPDINHPDLLKRLAVHYTQRLITGDYYADAALNQVLHDYQTTLADTYLLFPNVALRCLGHLRQFCCDRMLLLSADKGYSHAEDLIAKPEPGITLHGSFSLMVNYHAIGQYVQHQGGLFLTTPHRPQSLNICGSVFGTHPHNHPATRRAFTQAIVQNNPDDFYALKNVIVTHCQTLTLEQLLAYLRLSGWDAKIFLDCFSSLITKLDALSPSMQVEVYQSVQHIWDTYYPIGESRDLAFYLGMVLYKVRSFAAALTYFEHSRQAYGDDPNTLYNLGMCYYRLQHWEQALDCMAQILEQDPEFESAKTMQAKIGAQADRRSSDREGV